MASSGSVQKFFWNALDRILFIGIGAVGTIATTYVTGAIKAAPPELVVTQTYNYVDTRDAVEATVGGLKLDYAAEAAPGYGVLRVDLRNEGRGAAEDVRFQVKLPDEVRVEYAIAPDFKVYRPTLIALERGEFYCELPRFPSGAHDWVALRVTGDERLLCDARVKLVSEGYEGEIEGMRGLECR